jgi:hypothetical protein
MPPTPRIQSAATGTMTNQPRAYKLFVLFPALMIVLAFALGAAAQSGRRSNKPTQSPAPPVPAASPAALAKPSPTAKPRFTLTVGLDQVDSFSRIPITAESIVLDSCVARLSESGSVSVAGVFRNMGRAEALKKAKASTDAHVVWMRLKLELIGINPDADPDAWDIVVEYLIYEPTTAKVVGSGRAYAQRKNRSIIPTGRTGGILGERWYDRAGRDAAEQILATLNLPTKPLKVP